MLEKNLITTTQIGATCDKTGNVINVIYPYRTKHGWAFDDKEVGLKGEPFVAGVPQLIDSLVGEVTNFTAYLSSQPMPDSIVLSKAELEQDRAALHGWYEFENRIVWLCPATLKYFKDYPDKIYVRIDK